MSRRSLDLASQGQLLLKRLDELNYNNGKLEYWDVMRFAEFKGFLTLNSFVPYVGMVTIWMNEIVWIKYAVIGGLGLLAILQRDG